MSIEKPQLIGGNQLIIWKPGWRFELGTTKNKSSKWPGWVRLAGLQVSHADYPATLPGIIRVLMGILGGGVLPSFPILTLSQTKKCQPILNSHITLSFLFTWSWSNNNLHSYTPITPSKPIPDSIPRWAKCITIFRPKWHKNNTHWGGT